MKSALNVAKWLGYNLESWSWTENVLQTAEAAYIIRKYDFPGHLIPRNSLGNS